MCALWPLLRVNPVELWLDEPKILSARPLSLPDKQKTFLVGKLITSQIGLCIRKKPAPIMSG
jgi:hypothetical protein